MRAVSGLGGGPAVSLRGLGLAAAIALAAGLAVAPASPLAAAQPPLAVRVTGPALLGFTGSGRVRLTIQVTNLTGGIVFAQGSVTRSPGPPCEPEQGGACTPLETGLCDWYPELYPARTVDLACWGEIHPLDSSLDRAVSFRVVVVANTGTAVPLGHVTSGPIAVTVTGTDGKLDVGPQGGASPVIVRALRPGPVDLGFDVSTGPANAPGPPMEGVEVWALVRPADSAPVPGMPPAESTECRQSVGLLQGGTTSTFTCRLELSAGTVNQIVDFAVRGSVGDLVLERRSSTDVVLVPLEQGPALEIRDVRPRADADLAPASPGERVGLAVDIINRGTESLAINAHPEPAGLGRCSPFSDLPSGSGLDLDCQVRIPETETGSCALDVAIVVDGTASDGPTVSARATTTLALANPGCDESDPRPSAAVTAPPTSSEPANPAHDPTAGPFAGMVLAGLGALAIRLLRPPHRRS